MLLTALLFSTPALALDDGFYAENDWGGACFDLEAWNHGWNMFGEDNWGDDEVYEDTDCWVCAAVYDDGGKWDEVCQKGIDNTYEADCIDFQIGLQHDKSLLLVQTYCDDALWLDRVKLVGTGGSKIWGGNDAKGLCLSTDRWDHEGWNSDDYAQFVAGDHVFPNGQCYPMAGFFPDGKVRGYADGILTDRRRAEGDVMPTTEEEALEMMHKNIDYLFESDPDLQDYFHQLGYSVPPSKELPASGPMDIPSEELPMDMPSEELEMDIPSEELPMDIPSEELLAPVTPQPFESQDELMP